MLEKYSAIPPQAKHAFDYLKNALNKAPKLNNHSLSKTFYLMTDASKGSVIRLME